MSVQNVGNEAIRLSNGTERAANDCTANHAGGDAALGVRSNWKHEGAENDTSCKRTILHEIFIGVGRYPHRHHASFSTPDKRQGYLPRAGSRDIPERFSFGGRWSGWRIPLMTKIKLTFAAVTLLVGFGTIGASAMPQNNLSNIEVGAAAEQVRLVCDRFGRCWRRPNYRAYRAYGYNPGYYGTYERRGEWRDERRDEWRGRGW